MHSVSIFRDDMRPQLYSASFKKQLAGYRTADLFHEHASRAQTDDPLSLIQYIDIQTYLVGDINTKVDRASMAHALEVREPLMDHKLVEWLGTLGSNLKVRGGESKWLLKKSMEPHLPHDVMYRPKMGFAVPLMRWFRGPLRDRVRSALLDGELSRTGYFERSYLEHMVDAHTAGRRDYSSPLWSLLMFEAFLRKVADNSGPAPAEKRDREALPA
jgi:asparagine synthase (glutamine-hydrolysing)